MGNKPLQNIQSKYGQPGIDYLLHQYHVTKSRGSLIAADVTDNSAVKQDDMRYFTGKREQLQAHYQKEKQWLDKNHPGALEEATKKTKLQPQNLLGLDEELKKHQAKRAKLNAEYDSDAAKHSTILKPATALDSLPEYDNLPPKYKLDVLEDAYEKYGGGKSVASIGGQTTVDAKFSKLNRSDLDKQVEQGKRNITDKAQDLAGKGCCSCCRGCCCCCS